MDARALGFWISTALFCAVLGASGVAHFLRLEPIAEAMGVLGYPPYVMTMLGVAKVLGVAAVLAPGLPLLKEWAYAGFSFNLAGASVSHAWAGDPFGAPAVMLVVGGVSYLLRPESRRLR